LPGTSLIVPPELEKRLVEKPLYVLGVGLVLAQLCAAVQSGTMPTPSAQTALPNERIGSAKIDSLSPLTAPPPDQRATAEDAALQAEIQSALGHDPTLTHDSVRVSVLSDSIELTGSVGNSRERLTATRLAMSFAGSKRVISRITVGGASDAPLQAAPAKKNVTGNQKLASPLKAN
jgi:hypothetical protein